MSLNGKYQYQPLQSPDEFRVLILHPGAAVGSESEPNELVGDIVHEKVSEDADYVALSYVWGRTLRSRVFLPDQERWLSTTSNLHDALLDLRSPDRPLRLWVDALCINQDDVSERNHQVQQMRRIFSCARETIVYLGRDQGGNTGFSAWNFLEGQASWALNDKGEPDESIPEKMRDLIEFRGDIYDVEHDILERQWFRRVWVFQEVVVSKKVSLQCSRRRVPWDDFCKSLLLHKRYHDRYGESLSRRGKTEIVFQMFQARRAYLEAQGLHDLLPAWHDQLKRFDNGGTHILNTLEQARRLEATDSRDKIFALLGISTGFDPKHPDVSPDYSKTRLRAYMDLAAYMMETSQSYDVWSYLDHGGLAHRRQIDWVCLRLPSWVPNWNRSWCGGTYVPRSILSTFGLESDTERSAREQLVRERRWRLSPTTPEYVCGGVVIGVVAIPGMGVSLFGKHERAFQDCRDDLAEDPDRCFQNVMDLWDSLNIEGLPNLPETECECLPKLDKTFPPARESIESHLFARARKTVSWTDDNSKAVAVIRDPESIVDERRVGSVDITIPEESGATPDRETIKVLGLLPFGADADDIVVLFDGARLPFLVSPLLSGSDFEESKGDDEKTEEIMESVRPVSEELVVEKYQHVLPPSFGPPEEAVVVEIIGECLVNGYKELAERKTVPKLTFIVV